MYAYIEGNIVDIGTDSIVLENSGIGYEIQMALNNISELPSSSEHVRIYTYYQSGENGTFLYGFLKKDEKDLFLKLITVNGIGPKGALSILGTLGVDELLMAILSEDEKSISKAPGIGAKTAKRLILDLKDKVSLNVEAKFSSSDVKIEPQSVKSEAVMALTALGYSYSQAAAAVRAVPNGESLSVEDLLKIALKNIL